MLLGFLSLGGFRKFFHLINLTAQLLFPHTKCKLFEKMEIALGEFWCWRKPSVGFIFSVDHDQFALDYWTHFFLAHSPPPIFLKFPPLPPQKWNFQIIFTSEATDCLFAKRPTKALCPECQNLSSNKKGWLFIQFFLRFFMVLTMAYLESCKTQYCWLF